MQRTTNAAPDDANCDVCGEPNYTGDGVVFVSEDWCRRNHLTYSGGLKLCIWCRHATVFGSSDWITKPSRNRIPEETKKIKRKKERLQERREKIEERKEQVRGFFERIIDTLKW